MLGFGLALAFDRLDVHLPQDAGQGFGIRPRDTEGDHGLRDALVGQDHVQPEFSHLRKHLAEGFRRSRMTGEVLEFVNVEIIGFAGFERCPRSRQSRLFEAGHDQGTEEPFGFVVAVPQIDKEHFPLVHDFADVDAVVLLAEHVEEAGVIGQGADFVGRAADHGCLVSPPAVKLVLEKQLAVSRYFWVTDPLQQFFPEVVFGQQAVQAAQGFPVFNQGRQGRAHDLLETWRLGECPGPGAHEGGDNPLGDFVGFDIGGWPFQYVEWDDVVASARRNVDNAVIIAIVREEAFGDQMTQYVFG